MCAKTQLRLKFKLKVLHSIDFLDLQNKTVNMSTAQMLKANYTILFLMYIWQSFTQHAGNLPLHLASGLKNQILVHL